MYSTTNYITAMATRILRTSALLMGLVLVSLAALPNEARPAVVLGLNNNYGGEPALDILTPNLSFIASVNLGMSPNAHRVIAVEGIHIDRNRNGIVDPNEIYDLAFVSGRKACSTSGCGEIVIVNITQPASPEVIGRIPMPGIIRELDVYREKKILVAGGDRGASSGSPAGAFYVVDISDPFSSFVDNNHDGKDDRILWEQPLVAGSTGAVEAVRFDTVRNLVYVGNNSYPYGTLDIWNLYTSPNPLLRVDQVPESDRLSPGAYIHINDNDDNGNKTPDLEEKGAIAGEKDLRKITLFPKSPPGKVSLRAVNGNKIRVWDSDTKGAEVTLPVRYSTSALPKELYVEGVELSGAERDIQLIAEYTAGGFTYQEEAKITIVKVKARDRIGFECYGLDPTDYIPHAVAGVGKTGTFTYVISPIISSPVEFEGYDNGLVTISSPNSRPAGTSTAALVVLDGIQSGETTAHVKIAGNEVSLLDVSVYDERQVSVAFYFIFDKDNNGTAWQLADVDQALLDMNRIWEPQANVKFIDAGRNRQRLQNLCLTIPCRLEDWLLHTSLGSGLMTQNCSNNNTALYQEPSCDQADIAKVTAVAKQPGMPSADLNVFFVNEFAENGPCYHLPQCEQMKGFNLPGTNKIFVMDWQRMAVSPYAFLTTSGITLAHEAGHAFSVSSHATPGYVTAPAGELMEQGTVKCLIRKSQARQAHP